MESIQARLGWMSHCRAARELPITYDFRHALDRSAINELREGENILAFTPEEADDRPTLLPFVERCLLAGLCGSILFAGIWARGQSMVL